MENIFNGLLEFEKNEDFEVFVNSMDKKTSLKILELCIVYGQQNGLYNLSESRIQWNRAEPDEYSSPNGLGSIK